MRITEEGDDGRVSTMPTTHGLNGTMVAPDWPPLEAAEVRTLLGEFFEWDGPVRILSVSPRPFSAVGVVSAGERRVFVKRHHRRVRDCVGLHEEHRFTRHLREHGAQVPRVMESKAGETAIEVGDWMYEVHEVPAGVDLYEAAHSWTPFRSVAHAGAAGRALARLHRSAQGFDAPARRPRPLVASFSIFAGDDARAALARYLDARPALANEDSVRAACDETLELLAPIHEELRPLLAALEPLWTHNDLHASNLFWSDAGDRARATAIIDFGLADRTNAAHDLAHAMERNMVEWLAMAGDGTRGGDVPVHFDSLRALLDGYGTERALSAEEAAALAPMAALCHAEFALSEADYFLGVLRSREKAQLAIDYLVGHARWYRSPAGRRLLGGIRAWAAGREGASARGAGRR
jgi:Ser/Thr protein kinase RdoA (MazF antagonist)